MNGTFGTIHYRYFSNGKSTLAVILPGANLLPASHDKFIRLLSKKSNVLLINEGYFGLQKLDGINFVIWQNRTNFCENLHKLLGKFPYKKLVLLTSSVGTVHGLTYAINYPQDVNALVLAALPIGSNLLNNFLFLGTHLLLSTKPDFLLPFVLRLYAFFSRTKKVAAVMEKTNKNIGARTYLLCLKEIAIFSIWYKKKYEELIAGKNSPRTIIISGIDDPIFNRYCNTPLCQKASALYRVPARHAPFVEAPEETYNIIQKFLMA